MSTDKNRGDQVKVVIINTKYIETDARNFKSIVQKLTGKDAAADQVKMSKFKSNISYNNSSPNLPSLDNFFCPNYGR